MADIVDSAHAYLEARDRERAFNLIPQLVAFSDPLRAKRALRAIGTAFEKTGEYDRAIDAYWEALKLDPGDPDIIIGVFSSYMKNRQPEYLIQVFEHYEGEGSIDGVRDTYKRAIILRDAAQAYTEMHNVQKAVETYGRSITARYERNTRDALVRTLERSNWPTGMVASIEGVVLSLPNPPVPLPPRVGEPEPAYDLSTQSHPKIILLYHLANDMLLTGKPSRCMQLCDEILKYERNNPYALCSKGKAFLKLGELANAMEYLSRSYAALPKDPVVREALLELSIEAEKRAVADGRDASAERTTIDVFAREVLESCGLPTSVNVLTKLGNYPGQETPEYEAAVAQVRERFREWGATLSAGDIRNDVITYAAREIAALTGEELPQPESGRSSGRSSSRQRTRLEKLAEELSGQAGDESVPVSDDSGRPTLYGPGHDKKVRGGKRSQKGHGRT